MLKWGRRVLRSKDRICIMQMLIPSISSAVFCKKPAYGRVDPLLHVITRAAGLTWYNLHVINFFWKDGWIKVKRQQAVCAYLSAFWRKSLISKRTLLMLIRPAPFPTLLPRCALGLSSPLCVPKNLLLPLFGHQSERLSLTFLHKAKSNGRKWLSVGVLARGRCSQSNVI